MRQSTVLLLVLAVAGILAPFTGLYGVFLMKCAAFALFAVAFNFFTGYVGLLSIGHAAFFGMGAYMAGHAAREWGFTPELALLAGMALAQMIYFFCVQAPFTGAEDGLQRIPRGHLFGVIDLSDGMAMYAFVLVLALAGFWALQRIVEAPFGHVLMAIRDNEPRAVSLGYDVNRYKLAAFVISAAIAGLAGGLKAISLSLATLADVHWTQSGNVILMCLLGGLGTPLGPVIGAVLVVALESQLSSMGTVSLGGFSVDLSTKVPIVIGLIFMACVLAFRRGIVGEAGALIGRMRGRAKQGAPSPAPGE